MAKRSHTVTPPSAGPSVKALTVSSGAFALLWCLDPVTVAYGHFGETPACCEFWSKIFAYSLLDFFKFRSSLEPPCTSCLTLNLQTARLAFCRLSFELVLIASASPWFFTFPLLLVKIKTLLLCLLPLVFFVLLTTSHNLRGKHQRSCNSSWVNLNT